MMLTLQCILNYFYKTGFTCFICVLISFFSKMLYLFSSLLGGYLAYTVKNNISVSTNKQMFQSFSSSCTGWSSSTVLCSERLLLPAEEPVPPPFSCACSSPPSPSPPFWWPAAVPLSFGPLRPRFSFPPLLRFSILGRLRTPAVLRCVPSLGSMRVLAGTAAA